MPQQERKKGIPRSREAIASLDVKDANRESILNDGLVARIGEILGQAQVMRAPNAVFGEWLLKTPSGVIMGFSVCPAIRGRVMSADVLAHDRVKISYNESDQGKTVYMKGICDINLVRGEDDSSAVEFVQRTDKYTRIVEVSEKGVIIDGKGSATNIPRRFVKDFSFFPLF